MGEKDKKGVREEEGKEAREKDRKIGVQREFDREKEKYKDRCSKERDRERDRERKRERERHTASFVSAGVSGVEHIILVLLRTSSKNFAALSIPHIL